MNNEKRLQHEKPPSLMNQNNNLKDYIIAMNYYISGRCKDFCSLLRDLPERALVKEIGDLVTTYELIKEDIQYYQNTISSIQNDQKTMEDTMMKMQKREELCKVDCKRKIDLQVEIYEKYRNELNEQMQSKENQFIEETNKLKEQLEKEQKAFLMKFNECNRLTDLNAAFKKQILKQNSEFQSEMMQLQNVLQIQKEKYTKDTRALRDQNQTSINEIKQEHESSLKEIQEENDKIMKHYKHTCYNLQCEMIELQEQIQKQNEIYLRTKAMLEMSQIDLRDNDVEMKRMNELIQHQKEILDDNNILITNQSEAIENFKLKVSALEKQLLEKIEFLEIREQKWNSSVNDLMVEIEFVCSSIDIPKFIEKWNDSNLNLMYPKLRMIEKRLENNKKELHEHEKLIYEQKIQIQSLLIDIEQVKSLNQRETSSWIKRYQILVNKTKQIIKRQNKEALLLRVLRKTNLQLIKRLKKENKELILELRKIKNGKYKEIEQELIYLEEQKQMYRKIHKKEEDQTSSFEEQDEEEKSQTNIKEDVPWFLVEALSDETSSFSSVENPQEIAEDILEQGRQEVDTSQNESSNAIIIELKQQIKDLKKISKKYICNKCKEELKGQDAIISKKFNINQTKKDNQFDKRYSVQQTPLQGLVKSKQKKLEVDNSLSKGNRKLINNTSNRSKLNNSYQTDLQRDIFQQTSKQKNPQNIQEEQNASESSSSVSDSLNILQGQSHTTTPKKQVRPSIVMPQQLGSIVQSLREEQKIKQYRKNNKSAENNLKQIRKEMEQLASDLEEESEEQISLESMQKVDEIAISIQIPKKKLKFNKSDQSIGDEKQNTFGSNKSIFKHQFKKKQFGHKQKVYKLIKIFLIQESEDPETLQARYIEIIRDMEKKQRYQLQAVKQREEERLKELHLRQLKVTELSTISEEQDEKIKYFVSQCDQLNKLTQTLEAKLIIETNNSKQLMSELLKTEQSYQMRLDDEMASNLLKQKQLLNEIKMLKEIIQQRELELSEYKELYQRENQLRIEDNQEFRKQMEKEIQKFKQIQQEIEQQLASEKNKNQNLTKQMRDINEYLSIRPSKPEDIEIIKQLTFEGQKLEKSLKENYKTISHANEIVKYLQMELENYKQMYNMFQQKPASQTNQLNIENLTKQVFGLTYQKQFLKMLELQSQYDQDLLTRQNTKTSMAISKKTGKEGFNLALPRVTESREIQDVMYHTDTRKPNTKNLVFRNGKTELQFFERKRQRKLLTRGGDLSQRSRNVSADQQPKLMKRSRVSPKFVNPFEDDNIIMNAERFIRDLSIGPEINSDEDQKKKMSETLNAFSKGE